MDYNQFYKDRGSRKPKKVYSVRLPDGQIVITEVSPEPPVLDAFKTAMVNGKAIYKVRL